MKREHNNYLEDHPEVRRLLNDFVSQALVEQPADVFAFARDFFKGTAQAVHEPSEDADLAEPGDQDDLEGMLEDDGNSELRAYLKSVFESMDQDGNGELSLDELQALSRA